MRKYKDFIANISGEILFYFSLWLITSIISKISPNGYYDVGIFSVAMSFTNIFFVIATFQTRGYLVSDLSLEFSLKHYRNTRLITILFSFALCIVAAIALRYSGEMLLAIFLFMLFRMWDAYSDVFHAMLQIDNRLEYASLSQALKGMISVVFFTVILLTLKNIYLAMAGMVVVAALFNVFYDQRLTRELLHSSNLTKNKPNKEISALLFASFPMVFNGVLMMMMVAFPRLILGQTISEEVLGIYASVSAPTILISTFFSAFALPMLPYYRKAWISQKEREIYAIILVPLFAVFVLAVIGAPILFEIGGFVLSILYTSEISAFVDLFVISFGVACIFACVTFCNNMLLASRKARSMYYFSTIAFILVAVSSYPFIVKWNLYGAAYALALGYGVELLLQIVYLIVITKKHVSINRTASRATS
ncbi:MAG: Membrane protein involved in the export of O-antigen and teichoic acid [Erysipelotrichaceae bacterium]|nr:MAG: Membrane protein involved in the export of O-antigen and teichoic [Erysipelotrichaceae bacterium]TXT18477.1 MAG: Membrane protein involved in the export of O-antigen and teichoic acid [Erysipelotrichaceae bacterium]